jgi:hypothetical protein
MKSEMMLNPLHWKTEHRIGLVVSSLAGAIIGLVVGFETTRWKGISLVWWIENRPDDAALWALIGLSVVAAAIYCWRISN